MSIIAEQPVPGALQGPGSNPIPDVEVPSIALPETPEGRTPFFLPDKPVVSIRPTPKLAAINLQDVWAYRELLYFLTWRDVKVRYKQTALGTAWAVIQPLFTMLIFTLFFGKLAHVPSDNIPYPVFAFAGLLPWTFFNNAVTNSGNSLVGSSNLISKVYFPRLVIPAASVLAAMVDFAVAFAVLGALMLYYRIAPSWELLLLPALTVLMAILAMGVGMLLSALNVKYRDIRHALPFLLQIWMFVSPIIYPASMLPVKWRWLLRLNPLTGIIEAYRSALFQRSVDWAGLGISAAITIVTLAGSAFVFRSMEKSFADIV
ncbi:MAG TPA: ABC transporter permease [Blastocatellia bacterium]|nr:ABC transporter permease [Blastocatellia bacterium]